MQNGKKNVKCGRNPSPRARGVCRKVPPTRTAVLLRVKYLVFRQFSEPRIIGSSSDIEAFCDVVARYFDANASAKLFACRVAIVRRYEGKLHSEFHFE